MSFQSSSLRVAGQDSDIVDILFPFEVSRCHPDVRFSPMQAKQLYGDSESIKSWVDAIDRADTSVFRLDDSDVSHFAMHPFGTHFPHSPFSDEFESEGDVSFCLDASTWAPGVLGSSYYDDSDENHSESSLSDDAQYITIPSDSPWYPLPSSSPGPISVHGLTTAAYVNSCSSDVRQAIIQQEFLLAIFHQELRRTVPHNDGAGYDSAWLEELDADVVLEPLETYADLCWESAVCEKSPSPQADRPLPDVPMGFDEVYRTY